MSDLPYQAEYAKSGRAACKACKEKISQGELRIAVMVQSAFHDGKQPNWHHEECFFRKQRPKTASDISKLNSLRHADQQRIKKAIEDSGFSIDSPVVENGKAKGRGKGKAKGKEAKATKRTVAESSTALKDFAIEYSKTSRAGCRVCEIKICKGDIRISKMLYDTEVAMKFGGQAVWHHLKCFAEDRNFVMFFAGGESLPGFKNLSPEDQALVKETIKSLKEDEVPIKKLKAEPKDETDKKEEEKFNKAIEKQNKLFFKYRDALRHYQKKDLQELLEYNSQETPVGVDDCLDRLADCMSFGALEPCEVCKQGQLVLDVYGYKCTGNISEWTRCTNVTQNPKRRAVKIPASYKESAGFKKYKPKLGVRVFETAPVVPAVLVKAEPKLETNGIKKDRPIPPLKNLQFFIYGTKLNKEDIKNRILKLGGLVVNNLTDTLAAVVSNQKEIEKMNLKMGEIQEKEIEVIEEAFLDLIDPVTGSISNTLQLIKQHNIADWGSDPATRVPQDVLDGKSIPKSGSQYAKSKSTSTKLKLKGGTAVDPDSGLEDVAHVYVDEDGTKYTAVLTKTDVVAQRNSYYKIQVLEADDKKKFWFFRSWGRIGTTIGDKRVESCSSVEEALGRFEEMYMEKTENPWECRDMFMKVPGCYYPIDVDYGDDDTDSKQLQVDKNCKLPLPVQQLVMSIFDVNLMKQTLLEFELDTEKMPLGKLSKKQVKSGYQVLSKLLKTLEKGDANKHHIIDATNSFYTLIPHNFGRDNPPLLDSVELIKKKTEMLDNMLEIEIAYSLLKSDSGDTHSPIESHYLRLKAEIVPLARESPEFDLLNTYMKNTHAATHSQYTLEIQHVFKVVREGEEKRYKPFKKLPNRRLLWHGSRVTNFAGILSQGLRIAPPEAPVTGYMFGKGIYFADMVSKSANYCCTNKKQPVGVMLLCEVALGNMKECTQAEYVSQLPPGKHSVWGQGRTQPDPAQNKLLDNGTIVPLGTPVERKINTQLLYNEFIVYDIAQVNVQYLFQVKFNYKY